MLQHAWATTATATILRPCNQAARPVSAQLETPYAKAIMVSADGAVKPIQEQSPPLSPARRMPIEIPTWLLAGPGRNWQSPTRST